MAIRMPNNHAGIIDVLVLPKPKFLIEPSLLKRKAGRNWTIVIKIIKNNTIDVLNLFFLINDFIYINIYTKLI